MNREASDPNTELRRIVAMLDKTAELAHDGSLTGSMPERTAASVRTYNATAQYLVERGEIPAPLFQPLPEDATLADVGLSSAQLAEYLRGGLPGAPEEQGGEAGTNNSRSLIIGTLKIGDDKDELAQMVREHLAEWMREAREEAGKTGEEAPGAAEPAASSASPRVNSEAAPAVRRALPAQQARVEEVRSEQRESQTPR